MSINVKNKYFFRMIAFTLSIYMVFQSGLSVYASSSSYGGGGFNRNDSTSLDGFSNWSAMDKVNYFATNIAKITASVAGIVINPMNWNYDSISSALYKNAYECSLVTDSNGFDEWVASCLGVNEQGDLVVDDGLSDVIYLTAVDYIDENCGWYDCKTYQVEDFYSLFHSKEQYEVVRDIIKNKSANARVVMMINGENQRSYYYDEDGSLQQKGGCTVLYVYESDGLLIDTTNSASVMFDWEYAYQSQKGTKNYYCIDMSGNDLSEYWNKYSSNINNPFYQGHLFYSPVADVQSTLSYYNRYIVEDVKRIVRVYKTLDEYKAYSIGTRSYYTTSKFQDYDINGDNSCILSESELTNGSSVYGDVTNHIINNYDNSNGLSEDALIEIVDMLLKNNGGGSDNDDDDDDGGGSGLTGLLGGIGSLFDGIMAILGKLLEYIGKAIQLFSDTLINIVEVIPKGMSQLLVLIFPFIPNEWVVAIELGLVLSVIGIVIKLFKG